MLKLTLDALIISTTVTSVVVSRKLVNNHTFFQHPDLIRILRTHENVMAVMINTLGRRSQAQSDASAQAQQTDGEPKEKGKVCSFFIIPIGSRDKKD